MTASISVFRKAETIIYLMYINIHPVYWQQCLFIFRFCILSIPNNIYTAGLAYDRPPRRRLKIYDFIGDNNTPCRIRIFTGASVPRPVPEFPKFRAVAEKSTEIRRGGRAGERSTLAGEIGGVRFLAAALRLDGE